MLYLPICCLVTQSFPPLCDPMDCSTPGFHVLHYLLELAQGVSACTESVMPSNQLILCCPLLLLLSIFPRIRVFSNELALHIRWPKYWTSASASVCSMNIQGSFRIDLFGLLAAQELSRVFSSTTVQKYQFFSAQPSLWSNSHIYT